MIIRVKSMMIIIDVCSFYRELELDFWFIWEVFFRLVRVLGFSKVFGFRLVSYIDFLNIMIVICDKYMYNFVINNYNNIDDK